MNKKQEWKTNILVFSQLHRITHTFLFTLLFFGDREPSEIMFSKEPRCQETIQY